MLEAAGKTGDLLVKVLELLEGGEGKLTKKCVHIELSTNLHEVSQCLLNCQLVLTIKNLLRHYAKWVCICVSMVSRHKIRMLVRKDHNQRVVWLTKILKMLVDTMTKEKALKNVAKVR